MKTIIAAFRDQSAADQAIAFLHNHGVTDIELMKQDGGVQRSFEHLRDDLDVPDDRARLYADALQRGAPVLAAHAERDAEELADELDRLGSIDVETGMPAHAAGTQAASIQATEQEREQRAAANRERAAAAREQATEQEREQRAAANRERAAAARAQATAAAPSEETSRDFDIVEEHVVVGTREVPRGGVRVRTFVVEHPVHKDVQLKEEHINISREKVDEPISPAAAEAASLGEKEFVFTAHGEEPVVGKEARVVERVHVGKTEETRTEAIEDVERRRDVKVEPTEPTEPPPRNKR